MRPWDTFSECERHGETVGRTVGLTEGGTVGDIEGGTVGDNEGQGQTPRG